MEKKREKDPAAVKLGRKGGLKRAENLTADDLTAIGQAGAAKRWGKTRKKARARP